MILPLFDTLRVFGHRLLRGNSPFQPDRNHIHHLLLDAGCSHMMATGLLVLVNIGFIALAISINHLGTTRVLLVLSAVSIVLSVVLYQMAQRRVNVE
jgi:UDP-N-acetylmuramyl pentapeptide phosphotransferase/UDP-N-acetylglucosamine-1-phosphate transferase